MYTPLFEHQPSAYNKQENCNHDIDQPARSLHSLTYQETKPYKTTTGYLSQRRFYECAHCAACLLKPKCTKAKGNRRIQVSLELQRFRQQAKESLLSEQGIEESRD